MMQNMSQSFDPRRYRVRKTIANTTEHPAVTAERMTLINKHNLDEKHRFNAFILPNYVRILLLLTVPIFLYGISAWLLVYTVFEGYILNSWTTTRVSISCLYLAILIISIATMSYKRSTKYRDHSNLDYHGSLLYRLSLLSFLAIFFSTIFVLFVNFQNLERIIFLNSIGTEVPFRASLSTKLTNTGMSDQYAISFPYRAARIDKSLTIGCQYEHNKKYCVAPVLYVTDPTIQTNLFATGVNCCENGDFWCGGSNDKATGGTIYTDFNTFFHRDAEWLNLLFSDNEYDGFKKCSENFNFPKDPLFLSWGSLEDMKEKRSTDYKNWSIVNMYGLYAFSVLIGLLVCLYYFQWLK